MERSFAIFTLYCFYLLREKVILGKQIIFQRAALAFMLLLLATLTPAAANTTAARLSAINLRADQEKLDREDRIEVFNEVWNAINEKYYDASFNGVNWAAVRDRYRPLIEAVDGDDEFYNLMKKMVGELRDAHTRFHTPSERRERERLQSTSAGIHISEIEGQVVIVSVDPDSGAAQAGVEPGMSVRTIDGVLVAEQLAQARSAIADSSSERAIQLRLYHKVIDGEPGAPLMLGLTRADGTAFEVTIPRRTISSAPTVVWKRLASGFGYIKLSLWKSPIHKEFKNALLQLKNTRGIIIDLRGNPGGEVNEVLKIAGYFYNAKTPFGHFYMRSGKILRVFSGSRDDQIYSGTVAILINEGSGSGSEMFSGVMQESGRAVVIGRQSCGCLLGIAKFRKVEGGGELAISELGYVSPKGRKFEGAGVIPNGVVALTLADLQRQRDLALEEAEKTLKTLARSVSSSRSNSRSRKTISYMRHSGWPQPHDPPCMLCSPVSLAQ